MQWKKKFLFNITTTVFETPWRAWNIRPPTEFDDVSHYEHWENSNKSPDIEPSILCQTMLQILITLLKVCIRILTFITWTLESWSRRNQKERGTQVDCSQCPVDKNCDDEITMSTSSVVETGTVKGETAVNKNGPLEVGKSKIPKCPKCNERMTPRKAHRGGIFYGCSQWPACNGSRSWKDHDPQKSEKQTVAWMFHIQFVF